MVLAISRWSEVKEFIWDRAQVPAVDYSIFLAARATITPLQTVFSRYSRLLESVMGILHGKFVRCRRLGANVAFDRVRQSY